MFSALELTEIAKKLKSKKIKKLHYLDVEQVEVNCSVYVRNISNKNFANKDALETYFELRVGEHMLGDITMLSKDKAKVTFKDPSGINKYVKLKVIQILVILKVQKKKHDKLGPNVSIIPCTVLDSLDLNDASRESESTDTMTEEEMSTSSASRQQRRETNAENSNKERSKKEKIAPLKKVKKKCNKEQSESSEEGFTSAQDEGGSKQKISHQTLAQPVSFSLDPLVAKYFQKKPQLTDIVAKEFQVTITSNESGIVTISPTPSSPPDWSIKSKEIAQDILISALAKVDIPVPPQQAAETIYQMIFTRSAEGGLQYDLQQGGVSIAGDIEFVTKLKNDVNELTNRLVKKEEVISVGPEDYVFLCGKLLPVIQQNHPHVSLKQNDDCFTLTCFGSIKDVQQFKDMLPRYLSHCKIQVNIPCLAVKFLSEDPGKQILHDFTKGTNVVPYFAERSILLLLSANDYANETEIIATKIQQELSTRRIPLPKSFQSRSSKFNIFQANLKKTYTFIVSTSDDQNQLIIVSTTNIAAIVCEEFSTFITEECSVTKSIQLKRGVWRLFHASAMEKKWTDLVNEMQRKQITIISSSKATARKPFITLKGEKNNVEEAIEKVLTLQDSVKESQIPMARPGIYQYFFGHPNGQMVISGIENDAKVCIEMEVNENEQNNSAASAIKGQKFNRVCSGTTPELKTINVYIGDITEFNKADVIVNAANENLDHVGGVALAISRKGGPAIQQDSDNYVKIRGNVPVGNAVMFNNVGNLSPPYKAIVHAVGPRWSGTNKEREIVLLKRAVVQSFRKSKEYYSIAFPAISSGIFGFPIDVCANTLIEAAVNFSKTEPNATLSELNFIILEDNVDAFVQAAKNHIEDVHVRRVQDGSLASSIPSSGSKAEEVSGRRRRRRNIKQPTSIQITPKNYPLIDAHKLIKITNGDITEHQVYVTYMLYIMFSLGRGYCQ